MKREPLTDKAIAEALGNLRGWKHENGGLEKTFEFTNFREAVSFLVRVAFEAESLNHHPELSNVYNKVGIRLTTHDAGSRVTALDVTMAEAIEHFSWVR